MAIMWWWRQQPFSTLRQRIYLSLLGSAVWRQYRVQGLHHTLLCDMYGGRWRPAEFVDAMVDTLQRFKASDGYDAVFRQRLTVALQCRDGWSGVAFGEFGVYRVEKSQGWWRQNGALLPGMDLGDQDQLHLVVLGACVGAYMNGDESRLPGGLINEHAVAVKEVLADLWFEVCDGALTVTGEF